MQRGWDLWISSVVMVIIAAIFVGARFTQRVLKRSVGVDDWTILASLVSPSSLQCANYGTFESKTDS